MRSPPSILLIDDGELVRVRHVLERLDLSFEHRRGAAAEEGVPRPRHLLVSSAQRANLLPDLENSEVDPGHPIWVCAHTQDFLPMRQRLKELGFHYLIHSQLDREVMRLFFLQLLHRGSERRLNVRLPILYELNYAFAETRGKGRLEELSRGGCRLVSAEEATVGTPAVLYLPPELSRGEKLALRGYVAHCSSEAERSGGEGFSVIVIFRDLEPEARAQIESILGGGNLGTRITPLGPLPEHLSEAPHPKRKRKAAQQSRSDPQASEGEPPQSKAAERRSHDRREYARRLTALHSDGAEVLLGRDLSMTGVSIQRTGALAVGARLSIALYSADAREEPMVLDAEVVREDQECLGLRFVSLSPDQKLRLEQMLERRPLLEMLADDAPEGARLVVSKLVRPSR